MEWFIKAEDNTSKSSSTDISPYVKIEKIDSNDKKEIPMHFDAVTQFFLIPLVLHCSSSDQLRIPVSNSIYAENIIYKFYPHFDKGYKVYENDKLRSLLFKKLSPTTKSSLMEIILENQVDLVVYELYLANDNKHLQNSSGLQQYRVVTDVFLKLGNEQNDTEGSELWEFIKTSVLDTDGEINICPAGWRFDSSLIGNAALFYFAKRAKHMDIFVGNNNRISHIKVT